MLILCKMCYQTPLKIDQGSNKHGAIDKLQGPEIPLPYAHKADQSWNVTLTSWVQQEGGKYSWHTNRKWLKPQHNGASCTSSPHHTIPHFSLTHLCLWFFKILVFSSCSLPRPPTPATHISPHSPFATHPILTFKPKAQTKTRSYKSVKCSFKRKTKGWAIPCLV